MSLGQSSPQFWHTPNTRSDIIEHRTDKRFQSLVVIPTVNLVLQSQFYLYIVLNKLSWQTPLVLQYLAKEFFRFHFVQTSNLIQTRLKTIASRTKCFGFHCYPIALSCITSLPWPLLNLQIYNVCCDQYTANRDWKCLRVSRAKFASTECNLVSQSQNKVSSLMLSFFQNTSYIFHNIIHFVIRTPLHTNAAQKCVHTGQCSSPFHRRKECKYFSFFSLNWNSCSWMKTFNANNNISQLFSFSSKRKLLFTHSQKSDSTDLLTLSELFLVPPLL